MATGPRLLTPLERVLHLKSLEAFRELPPGELGVVARHAVERTLGPGERLYPPGERVASFHCIVEGAIRARGAEMVDDWLGPGAAVGLLPLLARWDDELEAIAPDGALTLEIGVDDLRDLLEDHFPIVVNEIRSIARRTNTLLAALPDGAMLGRATAAPLNATEDLDLIQRLLLMRSSGVFKRANMDALVELARHGRVQRLEPGTALWRRGSPSGFSCLVIGGLVRCERADGRVLWAHPGAALGNLDGLGGEPRWYDAIAVENTLVLRGELDLLLDVLEDHFETALDYLAAMADNLIRRMRAAAANP